MKLCRFGDRSKEQPGVLLPDGSRINVSAFGADYDEAFFSSDGPRRLAAWLANHQRECPMVEPAVRIAPCVARPSKLVFIGLNYLKHAAETGTKIPKEPVIFLKATSALMGANDDVVIPRGSQKTDWEVELAFVIGKRASYVSEAEA